MRSNPIPFAVRCFQPTALCVLLCTLLFSAASAADDTSEGPDPASGWKWNDPQDLKLTGVRHGTLESASMKRTVGFNIYLPPQYETEPSRHFPVVYFLHGSTGTESSDVWLAHFVQVEVAAGRIEPVIYVFPNGGAESEYRDWPTGSVKVETLLIRELIPFIDREYRTITRPGARAISGF